MCYYYIVTNTVFPPHEFWILMTVPANRSWWEIMLFDFQDEFIKTLQLLYGAIYLSLSLSLSPFLSLFLFCHTCFGDPCGEARFGCSNQQPQIRFQQTASTTRHVIEWLFRIFQPPDIRSTQLDAKCNTDIFLNNQSPNYRFVNKLNAAIVLRH